MRTKTLSHALCPEHTHIIYLIDTNGNHLKFRNIFNNFVCAHVSIIWAFMHEMNEAFPKCNIKIELSNIEIEVQGNAKWIRFACMYVSGIDLLNASITQRMTAIIEL